MAEKKVISKPLRVAVFVEKRTSEKPWSCYCHSLGRLGKRPQHNILWTVRHDGDSFLQLNIDHFSFAIYSKTNKHKFIPLKPTWINSNSTKKKKHVAHFWSPFECINTSLPKTSKSYQKCINNKSCMNQNKKKNTSDTEPLCLKSSQPSDALRRNIGRPSQNCPRLRFKSFNQWGEQKISKKKY